MHLSEELKSSLLQDLNSSEIDIVRLRIEIRYLKLENSELREKIRSQERKIKRLKTQCKR